MGQRETYRPWTGPEDALLVERCEAGETTPQIRDRYFPYRFKADATPADALNVARMLTVMCRQITNEAPDLLPIADSVPGDVLAYDWAEEFGDGAKAKPHKNVGF